MCWVDHKCYHHTCVWLMDLVEETKDFWVYGPLVTSKSFRWTLQMNDICYAAKPYTFLISRLTFDYYEIISLSSSTIDDDVELTQQLTFNIYDKGDASLMPTTTLEQPTTLVLELTDETKNKVALKLQREIIYTNRCQNSLFSSGDPPQIIIEHIAGSSDERITNLRYHALTNEVLLPDSVSLMEYVRDGMTLCSSARVYQMYTHLTALNDPLPILKIMSIADENEGLLTTTMDTSFQNPATMVIQAMVFFRIDGKKYNSRIFDITLEIRKLVIEAVLTIDDKFKTEEYLFQEIDEGDGWKIDLPTGFMPDDTFSNRVIHNKEPVYNPTLLQ